MPKTSWMHGVTRYQWLVLLVAWLGWVFDPEWGPSMLQSWDTYELTGGGEFFKQALHGKLGG